MQPGTLLIAQAMSLSGLIAASVGYASLTRRRHHRRIELQAATTASNAALDHVERSLVLGRIDRTFVNSAYVPRRRR
jgi:hypothetical protein